MFTESPLNIFFQGYLKCHTRCRQRILSQGFTLTSTSPQFFFIKQRAQLFPGTSLPLSGGFSNTSSNSEERAEAPALCVSVKSPRTERARAPGSAADDN